MMAGWWLIAGIALAFVSSFFASLVLSLHTLSRIRMSAHLAEIEHEPLAKRVRAILEDVQGHAAVLSFLRLLFQFAAAVCVVHWASTMRTEATPSVTSLTVGLLLAAILLWVTAIIVPMSIANHAGERSIIRLSVPIRLAHMAFIWVLPVWRFTNEVVRRLAGSDHHANDISITGSDLRSIVADDEVQDKLDETERDMLEAVVEFRSTSVEQIMTPRTEINAIEYTDDLATVQAFIDEHGHSRHPVYSENLDHIEGMLYAKDLLKWIITHGNNGTPFVLSTILREPSFVPETKTVRELLTQLLTDQVHIAIILDEYGGTSGLVTMEDIVEEIFGEIQDEYDETEESVSVEINESNNSAVIDARTEIDDANDELEAINIELPETDDYDTVAGFVNTILGRIPEVNEEFDHESVRYTILEAEPTRVIRVRIQHAPDDLDAAEENADSK